MISARTFVKKLKEYLNEDDRATVRDLVFSQDVSDGRGIVLPSLEVGRVRGPP